jgi:hypothetical protein
VRCRILSFNDGSRHSARGSRGRDRDRANKRRAGYASASPNVTLGLVANDPGTASAVDRVDGRYTDVNPWAVDRARPWARAVKIDERSAETLLSQSVRFLRLWSPGEPARPGPGIETPVNRFDMADQDSGR